MLVSLQRLVPHYHFDSESSKGSGEHFGNSCRPMLAMIAPEIYEDLTLSGGPHEFFDLAAEVLAIVKVLVKQSDLD